MSQPKKPFEEDRANLTDEKKAARYILPALWIFLAELRQRMEPDIRVYKRLPYEMAVFVLALMMGIGMGKVLDSLMLSLIFAALTLLAFFLWLATTYWVAKEPHRPRNVIIYDKFLFPGQFVFMGVMFVVSLADYGVLDATIVVLGLVGMAYIGTAITIALFRML